LNVASVNRIISHAAAIAGCPAAQAPPYVLVLWVTARVPGRDRNCRRTCPAATLPRLRLACAGGGAA